ncbi:dual specificity phosphatase 28 isoform X2 [Neoarius graeffei]|uniref:dual specificity phosphatase 28 isoform X2 n=1 Tax=Neoarius graeffei TaxID=443677 RepID=UPI00298CED68|nr:dual specificity phosphatase 28 isoform X2 [Neoarius graeffei]
MLQLCQVTDSLFISNARSACSTELIQKEAVTLCINVSRQQPCPSARISSTLRVPVYDDPNEDLHAHFDRCADVILGEAARGGRTVVYCKNGRSRSATICIAFLMKHQNLPLTQAYEVVKSARSVVEPNPGFWAQLEQYEQELKSRRSASSSLSISPS